MTASMAPNPRNVRVIFFAKARELAGLAETTIVVDGPLSCDELFARLVEKFGLESIRDNLILAVNEEFAERGALLDLGEGDEIAVIPPLSGGSLPDKMEEPKDIVKLQREKLRIDDIVDSVTSPSCGAISTFIGTTRDNFDNKRVLKLEYEAYEPMALKELADICRRVRSKWKITHIAIHHRLGDVPVSEASVAIAVSSPHRHESLRAVEFTIDTLKAKVPIWKKEVYDGDEPAWKENKECAWSSNDSVLRNDQRSAATNESKAVEVISEREERNVDRVAIDPSQVQIRADNEELNRRIESFIARKRQQVNAVNVQEFCSHRYLSDESEVSCARVDAILTRRKDSKSHVKVHRVLNSRGPQTMDPLMLFAESGKIGNRDSCETTEYPAIEERLSITEKYLGVRKPVPKNVYERLKNVEDRLLHLESVSPEYKDFWVPESADSLTSPRRPVRKRTFSTAELDCKLSDLEDRYAKKMK